MTTSSGPAFILGMTEELRQYQGRMSGPSVAKSFNGHAVPPDNVRDGDEASQAVCGRMTTVHDSKRAYRPRGGAAYGDCFRCIQHVTAAR